MDVSKNLPELSVSYGLGTGDADVEHRVTVPLQCDDG